MKNAKRILCLLLLCALLTSALPFRAAALEEESALKSTLAEMATAYVTKYVENTLLYRSEDLRAGTIRETLPSGQAASGENASADAAMAQTFVVGGDTVTAAQLCDNLTAFERCADYLKYIRTAQNIERLDFTYEPQVLETVVDGSSACVRVYTNISYKYFPGAETTLEGDRYTVWFARVNGQWCIVSVDCEANDASGLTEAVGDYDTLIADFDEWQSDVAARAAAQTTEQTAETEAGLSAAGGQVELASLISGYDRAYSRNNAVAYAYTYTTSSHNYSVGNNPGFNNDYFTCYTANCQNFVSQCLWAGFGGSNSEEAILSQLFPMDPDGSGSFYWAYGSGSGSNGWKAVKYMRYYFSDSNNNDQTTGMITNYVSDSANSYYGSLSNYTGSLSSLVGAPLYTPGSGRPLAHVVLIVEAQGKEYNQIYYCSHSPMRKYVLLSDGFSGSQCCLVIPAAMKNGRSCSANHTSHNFTSPSGITTNYCRYCGFKKLHVTGNMLKPVAKNTTVSVGGSANMSCYRMALCITLEDGPSTWIEQLNTGSISTSYTFSQTGLYTIQVLARDKNPEFYPGETITAEQTFTIRVY